MLPRRDAAARPVPSRDPAPSPSSPSFVSSILPREPIAVAVQPRHVTLAGREHAAIARINNHDDANLASCVAGDVQDCLSASEIDAVTAALTILPAATFYDLKHGTIDASHLAQRLRSAKGLAVVHVRYHWVVAEFSTPTWTVYDSARSAPVERDLKRIASRLGLQPPTFPACPQQIRGSNDCGVFAILNVLLRGAGVNIPKFTDHISLRELRAAYPHRERMLKLGRAAYRLERTHRPYALPVQPAPPAAPQRVEAAPSPPPRNQADMAVRGEAAGAGPAPCPITAAMVNTGELLDRAAASMNLCFMLVACAFQRVLTGSPEPVTLNGIRDLAFAFGYEIQRRYPLRFCQQDPIDALGRMGIMPTPYGAFSEYCDDYMLADHITQFGPAGRFAIVSNGTRHYLPQLLTFSNDEGLTTAPARFIMGATYEGVISGIGSRSGHYRITSGRHAVLAIYEPCAATVGRTMEISAPPPPQSGPMQGIEPAAPVPAPRRRTLRLAPPKASLVTPAADKPAAVAPDARLQPAISAAPVPAPAKKSSASPPVISHAQVRQRTNKRKVGDLVSARWTVQQEATSAILRITTAASPGIVASADVIVEQCPHCGNWRAVDEFSVELPMHDAAFFSFDAWPGEVPEADCECECDGAVLEDDDLALPVHQPNDEFLIERAVGDRSPFAASDELRRADGLNGSVGRHWQVFKTRPPHVHHLVWRQLSAGTRAQHIRWLSAIHGMPADLSRAPLPYACVELVLRMAKARSWVWSTIATALSAIASALRALPLYTNASQPIDIRSDPVFGAAMKRALGTSRKQASAAVGTVPLAYATYCELKTNVKDPRLRTFLRLCWGFAARVGDMRQVHGTDIKLERRGEAYSTAITFRFGKGAAFWGPYTIHCVIPADLARDLAGLARSSPSSPVFTARDQQQLSALFRNTDCNLRSIRKGALIWLASIGVNDDSLQLLSGHKRRDTLMRYLGWGAFSSTARHAAATRQEAVVNQAAPAPDVQIPCGGRAQPVVAPSADTKVEPAKMGLHAGYSGYGGRRVQQEPGFIPLQAPSRFDLGLEQKEDTRDWPIHAKHVSVLEWRRLRAIAQDTPFAQSIIDAQSWCSSAESYNTGGKIYAEGSVPFARITPAEAQVLLAAGKIEPHAGPIRGFAKAFLLPQFNKKRRRPIFEPSVNGTLDPEKLFKLGYPSRKQRRAAMRGKRYGIQFDFAAFFDQIELDPAVRDFFVIKIRGEDGHPQFWRLTRLPMGAVFAPSVAQIITWAILYPVTRIPGVDVKSMIDNVRIAADDPNTFLRAVRLFLQRVADAGAQLNEHPATSDDILREALQPMTFLGERYVGNDHIANTVENVEKLRSAWERIESGAAVTFRNIAAIVGLALWLAHTINIQLCFCHGLMRAHSRIFSIAARDNIWDNQFGAIQPSLKENLGALVAPILRNEPVPLPTLAAPSLANIDYDFVIIFDACKSGWAAFVQQPASGSVKLLQQRWDSEVRHSTSSEPRAAARIARWLWLQQRSVAVPLRVALVTDHDALARGQRRWWSDHGGFSLAYDLNCAFAELYSACSQCEIFYVQGELNPADAPSRDPHAPYTLKEADAHILFPPLSSFHHPFLKENRPEYFV